MIGTYSPALAGLAVMVAVFGSFVALTIAGRVAEAHGAGRGGWLVAGGVALGAGLWSMHFLSMLALRLPVAVAYDLPLTVLSALLAVGASIFALFAVGWGEVRTRSLLAASLLMAAAIEGMHMLGMAAMRAPLRVTHRNDLLLLAVAIALGASLAALWLTFRLRADESRRGGWLRLAGAVVMGGAVSGTHFTAMAAVRFHPAPGVAESGRHLIASDSLAAAVLVATLLILAIALIGALLDRELRRRARLIAQGERYFREAEAARQEAKLRAEHAEELAEELQNQASQLEEQATELEAVNNDLQAAEARLRAIVDSSLEAIVSADRDSVITDWNRHAEVMFGWTAEEAIGRRLTETIIPERFHAAHRRGVEHFLSTGEGPILNRRIEIVARRRDGSEFPVELTVAPARWGNQTIFSSFIRDITPERLAKARAAAEHEVVRTLAESRTLEEAAPRALEAMGQTLGWEVGVFWVVDREAGHLRFVDLWHAPDVSIPKFAALDRSIRFQPGQGLPGRVWSGRAPFWIEDIAQDSNFPRAPVALEEGLRSAVGFPVISGDECLGVIEFFQRRVLQADEGLLETLGAIGGGIGQALRRIQAEEERDRAMLDMARVNAELAHRTVEAERARTTADEANRAKSDFLANMSHELRTPLNAIIGYADLLTLEIDGPLAPGQKAQLERIRVSSQHLLALIEDILDLSKIEAGRMGMVREHALVQEAAAAALALVGPQAAERGLAVVDQCAASPVRYVGDPQRVRQILLNLLSNAVKFTEPGGSVTVRCGQAAPPESIGAAAGGLWTFVEVEDTGIGIAPSEVEAIFEPFMQAERGRTRTRGGTGLGLTISRQLAQLMGGELTLRSEPGKGSCFTLWLPAPQAAEAGTEPEPAERGAGVFAQVGALLQAEIEEILGAVATRLRVDPEIPSARDMDEAELEDHQGTFLADIAQSLVILAQTELDPQLLRDGSDVQHLLAARHGVQRARYGWTAQGLRREFEILRQEVLGAIQERTRELPQQSVQEALAVLERLIQAAEHSSLREFHAQPGPDSPPEP